MAMTPAPETPESRWREPESPSQPADEFALELRDVIKIFRSGPVETVALRGVSLQASPRRADRGPRSVRLRQEHRAGSVCRA